MTRDEMIAVVSDEIQRLDRVKQLLEQSHSERFVVEEPTLQAAGGKQKRIMSQEARRRIGLAQKRRWAKQPRQSAAAPEAN